MATVRKRGRRWAAQIRRAGFRPVYATFDTKGEAWAWVERQERSLRPVSANEAFDIGAKTRFREIVERYLELVTPHKRSAESERLRLGKMALAPLCDLPALALRPLHFAEYRDRRLRVAKPGTVRRELSLFRSVLERARREWGLSLPVNPLDGVGRPAALDGRTRRLSWSEQEALNGALATCRNPLIGPLISFLVETALRRGEALALRWTDVDWSGRLVMVRASKNGTARAVPLTDSAIAVLSLLNQSDDRIFPTTPMALRRAWERALVRAGLTDLRVHDLRHEALSRLSALGLNTAELQTISGHKDVRMLVRYTHPHPTEIARKLTGRTWACEGWA